MLKLFNKYDRSIFSFIIRKIFKEDVCIYNLKVRKSHSGISELIFEDLDFIVGDYLRIKISEIEVKMSWDIIRKNKHYIRAKGLDITLIKYNDKLTQLDREVCLEMSDVVVHYNDYTIKADRGSFSPDEIKLDTIRWFHGEMHQGTASDISFDSVLKIKEVHVDALDLNSIGNFPGFQTHPPFPIEIAKIECGYEKLIGTLEDFKWSPKDPITFFNLRLLNFKGWNILNFDFDQTNPWINDYQSDEPIIISEGVINLPPCILNIPKTELNLVGLVQDFRISCPYLRIQIHHDNELLDSFLVDLAEVEITGDQITGNDLKLLINPKKSNISNNILVMNSVGPFTAFYSICGYSPKEYFAIGSVYEDYISNAFKFIELIRNNSKVYLKLELANTAINIDHKIGNLDLPKDFGLEINFTNLTMNMIDFDHKSIKINKAQFVMNSNEIFGDLTDLVLPATTTIASAVIVSDFKRHKIYISDLVQSGLPTLDGVHLNTPSNLMVYCNNSRCVIGKLENEFEFSLLISSSVLKNAEVECVDISGYITSGEAETKIMYIDKIITGGNLMTISKCTIDVKIDSFAILNLFMSNLRDLKNPPTELDDVFYDIFNIIEDEIFEDNNVIIKTRNKILSDSGSGDFILLQESDLIANVLSCETVNCALLELTISAGYDFVSDYAQSEVEKDYVYLNNKEFRRKQCNRDLNPNDSIRVSFINSELRHRMLNGKISNEVVLHIQSIKSSDRVEGSLFKSFVESSNFMIEIKTTRNAESYVVINPGSVNLLLDQRTLDFLFEILNYDVTESGSDLKINSLTVREFKMKLDYNPRIISVDKINTDEIFKIFSIVEADLIFQETKLQNISSVWDVLATMKTRWQVLASLKPIKGLTRAIDFLITGKKIDGSELFKNALTEAINASIMIVVGTQVVLLTQKNIKGGSWFLNHTKTPSSFLEGLIQGKNSIQLSCGESLYSVFVLPLKIYSDDGLFDSLKCLLNNLPGLVYKPTYGLTEALSRTLIGLRNEVNPNSYEEDFLKFKN